MIKPIKFINDLSEITQKTVSKATKEITKQDTNTATQKVAQASSEVLQAYHGIKTKKLFESFPEFLKSFMDNLEKYKDTVPETIFKQVKEAAQNKNFSLEKIVQNYYEPLGNAKTLDEARKLYPELKIPDISPKKTIKGRLRPYFLTTDCENIKKLKTPEEQDKYIDELLHNNVTSQIENSPVFATLKKLAKDIKTEILEGKYTGNTHNVNSKYGASRRIDMTEMLATEDNPDKIVLQILKENCMDNKAITDISIKGKYYDFRGTSVKRAYPFSIPDKNFIAFIKSAENTAQQFKNLKNLETSDIKSALFTQTWKSSKLRADLNKLTSFGKDWSIVKTVWQKTMFPETTFYPTDKLIDTYLVTLFKSGSRNIDKANPLAKYLESPRMDKTKIQLLKRLYKGSRQLDMENNTINSKAYKEFKAQFDLKGMKEIIENIEEHYKNSFFKYFWTDERIARFKTALNQNTELANKNIEISDTILTNAMNNIFTE